MKSPDIAALAQIKKDARKDAKKLRKCAQTRAINAAYAAMDHVLHEVAISDDDIVSAYRPIFSELDPTPLMENLHARGVELCVPVIVENDRPLSFARWTPDMAMVTGAFGAEVPELIETVEPTLLFAPMLSFDRRGYRLGYGGGFYDRTLERLRALRPTRAIGYAFAAQEVPEVPIEPTDQRLNAIATEAGIIWTAGEPT